MRPLLTFLILAFSMHVPLKSQQSISMTNEKLSLSFDHRGLKSISSPDDQFIANALDPNDRFGNIGIAYKIADGDWLNIYTGSRKRTVISEEKRIEYLDYETGMPIQMKQSYQLEENCLEWTLELETKMEYPIEIGDLKIPFPWSKPYKDNQLEIFEGSFIKHHFIAGDASFLYFTKPSGNPPFLLVTSMQGTQLEYFSSTKESGYEMYICSGHSGGEENRGSWRQEHTFINLEKAGDPDSKKKFGLRFHWASSYDEMREILVSEGLFDIRVVPGMTIPSNLKAKFSLHSQNTIDSIVAEFPELTKINFQREAEKDHLIYEVDFKRLGENMLTIYYNGNEKTYLEFFSTEPLETLIKKRADFITKHQQHRDTSKWYNGLYSVYDMKNSVLRGPDNTDGFDHWWGYVLSCDDPGLCKAPYLAAKNVYFPNDDEIESVEYYIENFVWNGLQRTDTDSPYPYGIYGTPNWKVARNPEMRAGVNAYNLDKMHIWRSYDYPHIFMLYYHMYQIAKFYPEKVHYLNAQEYLERAYQTARAYWIYPYEILPWYETYKIGCYNELVVLDIIHSLEEEGFREKAGLLRTEWEKKVKYFVYDDPYPYGSEYSIDRTAFESSYALAKYGTLNEMPADTNLWFDKRLNKYYSHPLVGKADSKAFMERQHKAGLSVRGWLEPKYYLLGSDWTTSSDSHCLSYMAKMGGWSILDYGINFADQPWDWLQLGYASYLSSWALMNTGNEASDYGFWYPGEENDGAMGWAFMSAKYGRAWIRKDNPRGAWYYDGEADLGLGATFRMAQSILAEDPFFGWIAYGGSLETSKKGFSVIPLDGVRRKFSLISKKSKFSIALSRDCFAENEPILISKSLDLTTLLIENTAGRKHSLKIEITADPNKEFILIHKGKKISFMKTDNNLYSAEIDLDISGNTITISSNMK